MTDPVLAGLQQRRGELTKEARAADAALQAILANIEHIDATISLYDPAHRPRKIRLGRAKRVDVSRTALGILRQATAPMTLRDLTLAVMGQHGRDTQDKKLLATQQHHIRNALQRQKGNGAVRSLPGPGQALVWEVVK